MATPRSRPEHTVELGPRQSAARNRKRRALMVTSAAGAVLLVSGAATAAVIAGDLDPTAGSQNTAVPPAQTDPLAAGQAQGDEQESPQGEEQGAPETATSSAQGDNLAQEPEEEAEPEPQAQEEPAPSDNGGDTDGGSVRPNGQSGTCEASFYGDGFHGSTTANGETFDTYAMTAAHKTLPFDTKVKVTNPDNGNSVTVRINDRGPYIDGRCLDLSTAAFDEVIGTGSGVGTVDWQVVD